LFEPANKSYIFAPYYQYKPTPLEVHRAYTSTPRPHLGAGLLLTGSIDFERKMG